MLEEKRKALANFLGVGVEEVEEYLSNMFFECNGEEYLVLTDEEADEEFADYIDEVSRDLGISAFSDWAEDYILGNFIDSEWFDDAMREYCESYVDDIRNEYPNSNEFDSRLEEEMADANCNTEEEYVDYLCNQWEDGIDWYIFNFGSEDFSKIAIERNLIDFEAVIEYVKDVDGRGSALASYDGIENEKDGFYIYRIG